MPDPTTSVLAAIFTEPGTPPALVDVELAPPGPGEVEVEVRAAGVCGSDLHVVKGEWDVPLPMVLGHEGSGVVARVGEGVDHMAPGDHVVLSWIPQCDACAQCAAGRPWQCELVANVIGPRGVLADGTTRWSRDGEDVHHHLGVSSFAERVVVPAAGAVPIRKDAPLDLVAVIGCAVATGVGAVLNTAAVEAGRTVAVIGCGGVGLSVVQGARLARAGRIVAVDPDAAKREIAARVGATDTLADVAELRALAPDGMDYIFDAVGHTATTEAAIAGLGLGGAAVLVGIPPEGTRASFDPLELIYLNQRVLGSNYGSVDPRRDIPRLVDLAMSGELDLEALVTRRRPLAEAAAALDDLAAGREIRTLLLPGHTTDD